MGYLSHISQAEKRIHLFLRDKRRYAEWELGGKLPCPVFVAKEKPPVVKTKRSNQLMTLMVATQQDLCILCSKPLIIDPSLRSDHPDRPSFDHVIPRSKRGIDRGNRLAVHRQCNSLKSNRDPTGCELLWLMVVNEALEKNGFLFVNKRQGN